MVLYFERLYHEENTQINENSSEEHLTIIECQTQEPRVTVTETQVKSRLDN